MGRRAFDAGDLTRLRGITLEQALEALGLYVRKDFDFEPTKSECTERWFVTVGGSVHELIVTGPKWFDARQGRGGGGAIDLMMHLLGLDFVGAVKRLKEVGL